MGSSEKTTNKRVLVVDDSPFMLNMLGDMIKGMGYEVITALNGVEACKKIGNIQVNMIVTDLNMPNMDGIEFSKRVKANPACKFVPIVMLSCDGNESRIAEAKKMGISTFLSKPVKENQLKTILQVNLNY